MIFAKLLIAVSKIGLPDRACGNSRRLLLQSQNGHGKCSFRSHLGNPATRGGSAPALPADTTAPTEAGKAVAEVGREGGGETGTGVERLQEGVDLMVMCAPDPIPSFSSIPIPFFSLDLHQFQTIVEGEACKGVRENNSPTSQ